MTTTTLLAPPDEQPSTSEVEPEHVDGIEPTSSERLSRPFRLSIVGAGAALALFGRLAVANGISSLVAGRIILIAAAASALAGLGLILIAAERDRFSAPLMWLTVITSASWATLNWISPPFSPESTVWSVADQRSLAVLGAGNGLLLVGLIALAFVRRAPTLSVAFTLVAGCCVLASNSLLYHQVWPAIAATAVAFALVLVAWDRSPRNEPTFVPPDDSPRVSRAALSFASVAMCGTAIQLWISRDDIPNALPAIGISVVLIGAAFASLVRVRREIEQRETTLSEWTSWMREIRTRDFRAEMANFEPQPTEPTFDPAASVEPPRALSFPNLLAPDALESTSDLGEPDPTLIGPITQPELEHDLEPDLQPDPTLIDPITQPELEHDPTLIDPITQPELEPDLQPDPTNTDTVSQSDLEPDLTPIDPITQLELEPDLQPDPTNTDTVSQPDLEPGLQPDSTLIDPITQLELEPDLQPDPTNTDTVSQPDLDAAPAWMNDIAGTETDTEPLPSSEANRSFASMFDPVLEGEEQNNDLARFIAAAPSNTFTSMFALEDPSTEIEPEHQAFVGAEPRAAEPRAAEPQAAETLAPLPAPSDDTEPETLENLRRWLSDSDLAERPNQLITAIEAMSLDEFDALPPADRAAAADEITAFLVEEVPDAHVISWLDGPRFLVAHQRKTATELAELNRDLTRLLSATNGTVAFLRLGPETTLQDVTTNAVSGLTQARRVQPRRAH